MEFDLILGAPPKAIFAEVKSFAIDTLEKGSSAILIDSTGRLHCCTKFSKAKSFFKILKKKSK